MGELVGAIAGVLLWTELWSWIARKLGAGPRAAVVVGAVMTILFAIALPMIVPNESGSTIALLYGLMTPAWSGYRYWSLRAADKDKEYARSVAHAHVEPARAVTAQLALCACGTVNEPAANFCDRCGANLRLPQCSSCGTINRQEAIHCKHCGGPLAGSASR